MRRVAIRKGTGPHGPTPTSLCGCRLHIAANENRGRIEDLLFLPRVGGERIAEADEVLTSRRDRLFAERRIRGAMIDALRKDAWPRGVRRVRRELEAAREKLRAQLGHEPSLADLAAAVGSDEKRLGKTIVRINTIESTSPYSSGDQVDEQQLPAVLMPAEPERPDALYEQTEVRERVRKAVATLPVREQRVIALYYYGEVTMKEIGQELGVNESRVSQLRSLALSRLRSSLKARLQKPEARA